MEPIITVYKNQTKMNKGLMKSKIVTKIKPQKVVVNKVLNKTKIKKIEAQILTIINHKEKISNKKILISKVMTRTMMNNKEVEKISKNNNHQVKSVLINCAILRKYTKN